jgi:ketosteroid isomerase-like protein
MHYEPTADAGRNATAVRDFYARIDADDVAGMCALLSQDVVYRRPGYPDMTSRESVERFYREQRTISHGRHQLARIVATDRDIAVHGRFSGTMRDGSAAEHRFAEFFTVTPDGRISGRDTFFFVPLV